MTVQISSNIISPYPEFQTHLDSMSDFIKNESFFDASEKSNSYPEEVTYEQSNSRPSSMKEADDIVPELETRLAEQMQKEANEETTKSEDLRQFLVEMHETLGKSPKTTAPAQQPTDLGVSNLVTAESCSPRRISQLEQSMQDYPGLSAELAPISPPDGGWAWLIVLASFFCMVTIDGTCFNYGLLVPDMMSDFGIDSTSLYMWPGSLISGFYMIIGPVASALSNQYNFRMVAMAGGVISGVAILLSTFTRNIVGFIFLFGFLGGIGFSLIYLPAIAVVGHWFHEKRPIAVGMALCGSGAGTFVFGQIIPWLTDMLTWRGTVIIIAAVSIQALVFISLFRPLELHLRLEHYAKLLKIVKEIQKEEMERQKKEIEKAAEADKQKKKMEKDRLKQANRTRNKKIVIYRGAIMQKIIEEKKRQRTVSLGSLDGMVITKDNELVKVAMSSVDIYEKPIMSANALNRIREKVVKQLETKIKNKGPAGLIAVGDSRSIIGTNNNISEQIKNSLPQLVQDYITSRVSLQVSNAGSTYHITSNGSSLLNRRNSIQSSMAPKDEVAHSKTSMVNGLVLEDKAKVVIQASLRKELTRPLHRKEIFYTGSMRLLNHDIDINFSDTRSSINAMDKQSENSYNTINACNNSLYSQPINGVTSAVTPTSAVVNATDQGAPQGDYSDVMPDGDVESGCENINTNLRSQRAREGSIDQAVLASAAVETTPETDTNPNAKYSRSGVLFTDVFKELLDLSLLTNATFMLMVISSVIAMLGIFVPFFILPAYLSSLNINLSVSGRLISYVGIANVLGRLISTVYIEKAWSSSHKLADCFVINNAALILAGAAACSLPFCVQFSFPLLICMLFLYGFCVAAVVSLKSILVVELLGLNRLTSSFSFLLFFQGLATLFGSPIAGAICDMFDKRYEVAFYFTGCAIILSGILCFPLRMISQYEEKFKNRYENNYNPILGENNSMSDDESSFMDEKMYIKMEVSGSNMAGETRDGSDNNNPNASITTVIDDSVTKGTEEPNDDGALEPLVEEDEEEINGSEKKQNRKKSELFEVKVVQ